MRPRFYDSLRAEVADSGIVVTMVAPGYIKTRHSQNAKRGNGGEYPEGDILQKGVPPEVMAPEILAGAARKVPEIVPAAWDAKAAHILRLRLVGGWRFRSEAGRRENK